MTQTLNLLKLAFALNTLTVLFGAVLVNCFERYLPTAVSKLFRHGKFSVKGKHRLLDKWEVPKRWFRHFYVFAGPFSTCALALLHYKYFLHEQTPGFIEVFFKTFLGRDWQNAVPAENVVLAMLLFSLHCWKRFYESHYINVYSNVFMNAGIYFIGLLHYFGTVMSIVGEAYGIIGGSKINFDSTRLTALDYSCATAFLFSTYMQYRTNRILANLRRDKTGAVISKKYKIPYGELFEYITAPLQFTEIILYLCLSVILRHASTFHFVTVWVIVNQAECAYLSHKWSLKTFPQYPKNRKILIPCIF